MAKLTKASVTSLLAIAAAMAVPPHYQFAAAADVKQLVDEGLAIQNPEIKNDAGALATRLTPQGEAAAKENGYTGAPAGNAPAGGNDQPSFVIADVPRPKVARVGGEAGTSKYPFDRLNPGQSFFIPAPPDMKSPSKSFGSMVSGFNKRYSEASNFRRFTVRSMNGDAYDPDGSKGLKGKKGVGVFRLSAEEEASAKAKAFPAA